eukprot:1303710-Amphidinium_carterae.1
MQEFEIRPDPVVGKCCLDCSFCGIGMAWLEFTCCGNLLLFRQVEGLKVVHPRLRNRKQLHLARVSISNKASASRSTCKQPVITSASFILVLSPL